jgi:hypothetical protein
MAPFDYSPAAPKFACGAAKVDTANERANAAAVAGVLAAAAAEASVCSISDAPIRASPKRARASGEGNVDEDGSASRTAASPGPLDLSPSRRKVASPIGSEGGGGPRGHAVYGTRSQTTAESEGTPAELAAAMTSSSSSSSSSCSSSSKGGKGCGLDLISDCDAEEKGQGQERPDCDLKKQRFGVANVGEIVGAAPSFFYDETPLCCVDIDEEAHSYYGAAHFDELKREQDAAASRASEEVEYLTGGVEVHRTSLPTSANAHPSRNGKVAAAAVAASDHVAGGWTVSQLNLAMQPTQEGGQKEMDAAVAEADAAAELDWTESQLKLAMEMTQEGDSKGSGVEVDAGSSSGADQSGSRAIGAAVAEAAASPPFSSSRSPAAAAAVAAPYRDAYAAEIASHLFSASKDESVGRYSKALWSYIDIEVPPLSSIHSFMINLCICYPFNHLLIHSSLHIFACVCITDSFFSHPFI